MIHQPDKDNTTTPPGYDRMQKICPDCYSILTKQSPTYCYNCSRVVLTSEALRYGVDVGTGRDFSKSYFFNRKALDDIKMANCPICKDTGSYTIGGSFGGPVTTHKCECVTTRGHSSCEHPYKFVKQSQDNEYPDYCTKCESYI